jgi:hypothetical protein
MPNGFVHCVEKGFVTDFASIPSLARIGSGLMLAGVIFGLTLSGRGIPWVGKLALALVLLGFVICWLSDDLNCDPLLDAPATLHDHGYRRPHLGFTLKFYWDWILFCAMRANGEPLWKCWLVWFNVTVFGWLAWWQDGKQAQGGSHD